jgi:hypothetical protein
MNIDYEAQVHVYQALVFVLPFVTAWIAKRVCEQLLRSEAHPLRGPGGGRVRRTPGGGFEAVSPSASPRTPEPTARR